ncbi:hypothetical protein EGH24_04325 [Halonotius terrestris]|uniref:DUF2391 family protein n=1 Tax=Halonotius terrestris TaxID=2487750 RepID=A0A8J8TD40_9EURY|nr:DUF2391 family protein [Halonotius terrestris]TQQ82681.1 hypothetical protein EGH24_04325 [Halonotius terrestris]
MAGSAPTDDIVGNGSEEIDPSETTIESLFADLRALTAETSAPTAAAETRDIKHLLAEAYERGLLDSEVRELQARDAAEAFVGSVIFASPLLVEDGVFDIGTHLFESTVAGVPIFLIANTLFVVLMTYALLEWTGRNQEETTVVLRSLPVRVVMILVVSFFVAAVLMTVWGRVNGWADPVEAVARINVIWTVGSIGAALGDILSENDPAPSVGPPAATGRNASGATAAREKPPTAGLPDAVDEWADGELVSAINAEFDDLESVVDERDREAVNRIREETVQAALDDGFGDRIQKYTSRDIAEAFVGSVFFAIPFLVEDGVFEIAGFFLSVRLGGVPVAFVLNAAFVLLMILALVYWAGPQDVRVNRPIFGLIPRRLVGIAVVSFLTAAALMTLWGRVDGWREPVVALARISVVWTVASFGASLGDILPGESSGADINDDLAALTDGGDSAGRSDSVGDSNEE